MAAWLRCESGVTGVLETCWRMAGGLPELAERLVFSILWKKRMQKRTLHLDAYGTIQTVTALDAEVRETLFRRCTALWYENHIIKAALRAGPEAFLPPACLP